MKKAMIVVRVLLGALFAFASICFFSGTGEQPEFSGAMATFMSGVNASGYLLPLSKAVELLCAASFITGYFVPLALIVLLPVSVNIFFIHVMMAPQGLPIALVILAANLFLAYGYRDRYTTLFQKK